MGIFSVYIISKAGGLIFSHDMPYSLGEGEVEYREHPVSGLTLEEVDRNIMLKFGEVQAPEGPLIQSKAVYNSIALFTSVVGYSLIAINGQTVTNKVLPDGRCAQAVIDDPASFPLRLKFRRLKASVNERIMLLSMFHSLVVLDNLTIAPFIVLVYMLYQCDYLLKSILKGYNVWRLTHLICIACKLELVSQKLNDNSIV